MDLQGYHHPTLLLGYGVGIHIMLEVILTTCVYDTQEQCNVL